MNSEANLYEITKSHMVRLGLSSSVEGLSQTLDETKSQSHLLFLQRLLSLEIESRAERRYETLRRFAGFPAEYRLSDYDFEYQPKLDGRIISELANLTFIRDGRNVIFIGPPGVGKTMLAVALGYEAITAGYKTIYISAIDLVTRLHKAALDGRFNRVIRPFESASLIIIDELGYLPMGPEGASYLFDLVSRRYLRGSIIITTNRPISSWGEVLSDEVLAAAMLDRLLHRCSVIPIDGESYRMREYLERSAALRKGVGRSD